MNGFGLYKDGLSTDGLGQGGRYKERRSLEMLPFFRPFLKIFPSCEIGLKGKGFFFLFNLLFHGQIGDDAKEGSGWPSTYKRLWHLRTGHQFTESTLAVHTSQ